MFEKSSSHGYSDPLPGIRMKTISYGERTLMAEFRLSVGAELPRHSHPHEQTGYLVAGRMQLTIGDCLHEVAPGDSWCIPGEVPHCARAVEESVAVEVFSPVREDYLPPGASPAATRP